MTLPVGAAVLIGPNQIHPRLAGRRGVVVSVTDGQRCQWATTREGRKARCGGNPIVEVACVGKVLLTADCLTVIDGVGVEVAA